jgi:very-short-patch-repair endonuclease
MTDSPGTRNYIRHHPARLPEDLPTYAREMRPQMTDAEALLWKLLRNRRIANANSDDNIRSGIAFLVFIVMKRSVALSWMGVSA